MQVKSDDVPEVLTVEEAAQYLKVSPASVRRMVQANRIPYFRIGKRNIRIFKTGLVEALSRSSPALSRPEKEG